MLKVDSIEKGIVLDHIQAGKSMHIYEYLNLQNVDCSVAIIKNVKSNKMGLKDIIKINDNIDINLDVLGFIDPNITVNIIENGNTVAKKHLTLPDKITNIVKCKNPRCITSCESSIDHIFKLADPEKKTYRCLYCEQETEK